MWGHHVIDAEVILRTPYNLADTAPSPRYSKGVSNYRPSHYCTSANSDSVCLQ